MSDTTATPESKAGVVIQDDMRGDTPYFVYEVDDLGNVVTTLGNFETVEEATTEADAYASAAGLTVRNDVVEETPAEPAPEPAPETPAEPAPTEPVTDVPTTTPEPAPAPAPTEGA